MQASPGRYHPFPVEPFVQFDVLMGHAIQLELPDSDHPWHQEVVNLFVGRSIAHYQSPFRHVVQCFSQFCFVLTRLLCYSRYLFRAGSQVQQKLGLFRAKQMLQHFYVHAAFGFRESLGEQIQSLAKSLVNVRHFSLLLQPSPAFRGQFDGLPLYLYQVNYDFSASHFSITSNASPVFPIWQWFCAWSFCVKMRPVTDLAFTSAFTCMSCIFKGIKWSSAPVRISTSCFTKSELRFFSLSCRNVFMEAIGVFVLVTYMALCTDQLCTGSFLIFISPR